MSLFKKIIYFFCNTCRPNRSRTVRYAFPVVISALAILSALTVTSLEKSTIEVVPSETNVTAGQSFTIDVYVTAVKPVNAVNITVAIPTSQISVTGVDTGESVITLWTEQPKYKNGSVTLSGGTFRKGFLGRHLIATINAKAVDSGLAYVNVTDSLLLAGDGSGTKIETEPNTKEEAKLYIANSNGLLDSSDSAAAGTFESNVQISIVTDIDGDGDVTLVDVSRFMAAWSSHSTIFDFSGDGKMTFTDFAIILADSFFH